MSKIGRLIRQYFSDYMSDCFQSGHDIYFPSQGWHRAERYYDRTGWYAADAGASWLLPGQDF